MYSSYTAAVYARLWELARARDVNLEGALTWAFTFVAQPWFAGYRQLATRDVDLPVMNAMRLLARLGDEQISANSSGQVPLPLIVSDGVRTSADVGVLATRTAGGRVDILLWHYRDDDVPGPAANIHLSIAGLAPGRREAHVWRVDAQNGDAFSAWKAMGSPATPTQEQLDRLKQASRMVARAVRLKTRSRDGTVTVERSLPQQGVELIELRPRS
jgi:xylan 1,4-beta-xylosidase